MIREMFGYARDHEPCIIFMDEIDAIGGRRFSEGALCVLCVVLCFMLCCVLCLLCACVVFVVYLIVVHFNGTLSFFFP